MAPRSFKAAWLSDGVPPFDWRQGSDLTANQIIWSEQAWPGVVRLIGGAFPEMRPYAVAGDLSSSDRRLRLESSKGPHDVVAPRNGLFDAAVLPLDDAFETRLQAANLLWRTLRKMSAGRRLGVLPRQTIDRHILNLRVFDARAQGASYRQIAETLLSRSPIEPRDWRDHPLKHRIKTASARASRLVAGGYRDLLYYPHRRRVSSSKSSDA